MKVMIDTKQRPQEIADKCRRIQSHWTLEERRRRKHLAEEKQFELSKLLDRVAISMILPDISRQTDLVAQSITGHVHTFPQSALASAVVDHVGAHL